MLRMIFFIMYPYNKNLQKEITMNKKQKFIAGAMALTLITSAAPMSCNRKQFLY